MDHKIIERLINNGIIICGRKYEEDGIVRFERVDPTQIESLPENERAYATSSMGRAIFTIDEIGRIHNFKGVDSHLKTKELGPVKLVNARSIGIIPNGNSDNYEISAVVFNGKKPEIRINGTSPLEDIEIEKNANSSLSTMGVKVPNIKYIREIPQGYSLRHGLPIKVGDTHRPEFMREYLERIGFFNSKEVQKFVTDSGYRMEDFVSAVDESYSEGQRYGQAERIMGNPFRISDIETCITHGDINGLQAIFDFSNSLQPGFENNLARCFGRNIALLMNHGWECENLFHRQDFSLAGEFCDDAYFDIMERRKEIATKHQDKPYVADAFLAEYREKYTGQIMHIASCVKVVQDAMRMLGRNDAQVESVLSDFVDSFDKTIDMESIAKVFRASAMSAKLEFLKQFHGVKSWSEKLAVQYRREGRVLDDAILLAHEGNDDFYKNVALRLAYKMLKQDRTDRSDRTFDDER